jgi:subtilisin family serine protease
LDGSYSSTRTGSGVHAYIIDTGILFSHPEFQGRASLGFDVNGSSGVDCNGHGTHVSGTVGGINYGVAKQVSLVAVKIFPGCESSTPTSSVLSGMEWVLQNAILPAVVNMSVGGDSDPLINEAVQSLTERGITVVVAAGNTALDACLGSPSSAPSAITVGATDQTDTRAPFSSWGSCVDIFAPGVGITSAWKDGGSLTISGTSMATPHVSGVVALYLGEHPQGLPSEVSDSINAY